VTAAGLTAFARRAGCSDDDLGIRAADAAAGLRLGLAAVAVAAGGVVLGASLPATRPLFQDRRVTAVGRREAIYHLAVRIPLATAVAEELAFRGALLGLVQRRRSPAAAVAWTSLVFGASHALPTLKHYDGNPASGLVADPRQGGRIAGLGTMLSTAGPAACSPGCGCGGAACSRPSSPTPPPMPGPTWQGDGWSSTPAEDVASIAADRAARCRHLAPDSPGAILGESIDSGRRPSSCREDTRMYLIRERFFRLGEDSDITDEHGRPVLHVDGKVLSLRNRLVLRDPDGREVAQVQRKLVAMRPTYQISVAGQEAAEVRKRFFTPFGDRFAIDVPGPDDLEMRGNLFDHEFTISRGGRTVATVSKGWFSMRDIYAVDVAPGQDDLLILASVLALDLAEDQERRQP